MRERVCVWTARVFLLLLLCSDPLDCQHATDHRKVPQRAKPQQEFREEHGEIQGSWGSWGPWGTCSRTCGSGVQEQSRPCLHVYAPSQYSSPRRAGMAPPQQPGHAVWSLWPTVPLHRDGAGTPDGIGREELKPEKEARPGEHRSVSLFNPGSYGYGKAPFVAPLQTDETRGYGTAHPYRQRRSAAADTARGHRSNNPNASGTLPHYGRPYTQPKNKQVWAPLYQPGPARQAGIQPEMAPRAQTSGHQQHQDRRHNPPPTFPCTGEHVRYQLCNSNACPPSSRHIRAVQCSSYNNQPFMGRLYMWEPFNEVPAHQSCELNCRAVGFRFYVRQSDKVIDGTPCVHNGTSLCVAGKCTCRVQM